MQHLSWAQAFPTTEDPPLRHWTKATLRSGLVYFRVVASVLSSAVSACSLVFPLYADWQGNMDTRRVSG